MRIRGPHSRGTHLPAVISSSVRCNSPCPLFQAAGPEKKEGGAFHRIAQAGLKLAPWTSLAGGLMMVAASFLPGPATLEKTAASLNSLPNPSQAVAPHPSVAAPEDETLRRAQKQIALLKDIFTQLGWGLSSTGVFLGGYSTLRTGLSQDQPSMALAGLTGLASAPLMVCAPSVATRTLFQLSIGLLLSGFANKVKNDYQAEKGGPARTLDMRPLVDLKRLKSQMGEGMSPTNANQMNAWFRYAFKTFKFVMEDQVLVIREGGHALGSRLRHPLKTVYGFKNQVLQTWRLLRGKELDAPAWLKPSPGQSQVASLLIYSGGIPLLLLGGGQEAVTRICTALISAGTVPSCQSLFAVGLSGKGLAERSMLVGVPLCVIGNGIADPLLGKGIYSIGRSSINAYYAKEAQLTAQQKRATTTPSSSAGSLSSVLR